MKILRTTLYTFLLFLFTFFITNDSHSTTLPQNHQWQITLRDYLAQFEESDFDVDLDWGDFRTDFSYLDGWSDDEVFRFWTVFGDNHPSVPDARQLVVRSEWFVLSSIEHESGIRFSTGHNWRAAYWGDQYPEDYIFWYLLDVPTNPFKDQIGIANRAIVSGIVDLIMIRDVQEFGSGLKTRTDYAGGYLIRIASIYWALKDLMPQNVQDAYMEGMKAVVDYIDDNGPQGVNDNMDFKAVFAFPWFYESVEDQQYKDKVSSYIINRVFNHTSFTPSHPAGMVRDAGGIEASYNGIALSYAGYAAAWSCDVNENHVIPELHEHLDRWIDFRSHLMMEDPDGRTFGPNHFNSRVNDDVTRDQNRPTRFRRAVPYILQGAVAGLWDYEVSDRLGGSPPTRSNMISNIETTIGSRMSGWDPIENTYYGDKDNPPMLWHEITHGHWTGYPPTTYFFYQDGWYQHFVDNINNAGEDVLIPSKRSSNFIKRFPVDDIHSEVHEEDKNTALAVKFDDYYALIYTGNLGWHGNMNHGGAALSSFWTPETGAILHGRSGGNRSENRESWQDPAPDDPRGWRYWPTHRISGETSEGEAFSTSRIRNRVTDKTYDISEDSAYIKVVGNIGHDDGDRGQTVEGDNTLPNGAVYTREYWVNEDGVTVKGKVESNGQDEVSELYEIFPVFIKGRSQSDDHVEDVKVQFYVNEGWSEAGTSFTDDIEIMRIDRFNGSVYLHFSNPVKAKLADKMWSNGGNRVLNIHIDLLGDNTNMPTETSVEYTIKPAPKYPGGVGLVNPENNADSLPTSLTFQWEEAPRTDTYQLQVSSSSNFSNPFFNNENITSTSQSVSGFVYNTQYYWRVRGLNEHGEGNWSEVRSFTTVPEAVEMEIPLSAGWNQISAYIQPEQPAMEDMFADLAGNLVMVKNPVDSVYWPEYDINTIGNWNPYSGYQVFVDESDMLSVSGALMSPESHTINLQDGWNQIAYLRQTPLNVSVALSAIQDKIELVSNNAGDVYWPEYEINTIGYMLPGQGYKVTVTEDVSFSYPANGEEPAGKLIAGKNLSVNSKQERPLPARYNLDFTNTGDYAILLLLSDRFEDGDEIGVWSPENDLVGSGVAQDGRVLVTIWGKNPVWKGERESKGVRHGASLRLTQWSAGENREFPLPVTQLSDLSRRQLNEPVLRYQSNAVWIAEAEALSGIPERYTLEQNYPNPFNPTTTIRYGIPEPAQVRIEIYNTIGQKIKTLVDEEQHPGYHQVVFNANNVASGVYFYRLQAGHFTEIKRMVLVR